jgi:transcriptional regulator with XRE-family HTH domain
MVRVNGRKLREWRERRLLTLRELAARSGVQFHTIHAIETGKQEPRVSTLRKLIEALGIPVEEVLALDASQSEASTKTGKAAPVAA